MKGVIILIFMVHIPNATYNNKAQQLAQLLFGSVGEDI